MPHNDAHNVHMNQSEKHKNNVKCEEKKATEWEGNKKCKMMELKQCERIATKKGRCENL